MQERNLVLSRIDSEGSVSISFFHSLPSFFRWVKGLDLYSRVDESFAVKTDRGGILTIVAWIIIFSLCLNEFLLFSRSQVREHLVVDSSLNRKLSIYLNMTLHGLHCPNVHLDSMDIAGDSHLSLEHSMIKRRLDLGLCLFFSHFFFILPYLFFSTDGNTIGSPVDEYLSEMDQILAKLPPDYCGSCYGAENPERRCCNTCSELITAYREKGWSSDKIFQDSEQVGYRKRLIVRLGCICLYLSLV